MNIATRLDKAMKAAGIPSQSALARAADIPQPTVNRILKGVGKRGPEAHTVAALARACNVSFLWLFEGVGPMRRTSTTEDELAAPTTKVAVSDDEGSDFVRVPMVNQFLHAGIDGVDGDLEYDEGALLSLPRIWVEQKGLNPGSLLAIKVKGDSMYPTLKNGNTVVVNTADRERVDGVLYAVNHGSKAVVKRVEHDGGIWYLASDNPQPEFRRRAIEDSETTIIGRVVKMEADFI